MATNKNKTKRRTELKETLRERINKADIKQKTDIKTNKRHALSKAVNNNVSKIFTKLNKNIVFKVIFKFCRILSLVIVPRYLRNSWAELKLVAWPNFKLSRQLTFAVIIFAIFIGISVASLDSGLSRIFKVVLLK